MTNLTPERRAELDRRSRESLIGLRALVAASLEQSACVHVGEKNAKGHRWNTLLAALLREIDQELKVP